MYTHITHTLLSYRRLLLLLVALPCIAYAGLPESNNVPGGLAVIPLASTSSAKPQAWLGEQAVLVTADKEQWYAVVGLALSLTPGVHELRISQSGKSELKSFEVGSKAYPEQHITIKDNGKVELSPKNLARAKHDIANIMRLKKHWQASANTDLDFIIPAQGELSSRFGLRRFFNEKPRAPHVGLDVAVASDTPVLASSAGTVLATDDYFFNGKTVFLDHGNGLITMYCHMNRFDVQPGETVSKGQQIGLSGMTGRATGPHLHWSVVLNGAMVDPELFIQHN